MNSLLKNHCLFIHRHFVHEKPITLSDSLRFIMHHPFNLKRFNEFCVGVLQAVYQKYDFTYSASRASLALKAYISSLSPKDRREVRKAVNLFYRIYKGDKTWWITPHKEVEKLIKDSFVIVDTAHGNDHAFAQECFIYVLKKRV